MNYNVKQFIKGDIYRLFPLGKSSNFLSALGLSQILDCILNYQNLYCLFSKGFVGWKE